METKTTADGNTFIIKIMREKTSAKEKFGRISSFIIGLVGFIFSLLLCITLIGIFFAIPLFGISIVFFNAALEKHNVQSSNCGHKRSVKKIRGYLDCGSCKKHILVGW
ncbi:hypothetical protein [Bacillus cereus]